MTEDDCLAAFDMLVTGAYQGYQRMIAGSACSHLQQQAAPEASAVHVQMMLSSAGCR